MLSHSSSSSLTLAPLTRKKGLVFATGQRFLVRLRVFKLNWPITNASGSGRSGTWKPWRLTSTFPPLRSYYDDARADLGYMRDIVRSYRVEIGYRGGVCCAALHSAHHPGIAPSSPSCVCVALLHCPPILMIVFPELSPWGVNKLSIVVTCNCEDIEIWKIGIQKTRMNKDSQNRNPCRPTCRQCLD